jgi:polyhydroxybutyrate depolymerase
MTRQTRRWCVMAILLAVVTVLPVLGATPRAQAQTCSLTPTGGTEVREIDPPGPEIDREYRLRVPAGLTAPAMLVVSLHPYTADAQWQEGNSGLSDAADQHKFIVAYPEGEFGRRPALPLRGWNTWDATGNEDIDFILAVVDDISGDYCIDRRHVHAEGFSLGGGMSQRMACAAPQVFASAMSHAATDVEGGLPGSDPCTPTRPISVFLSCTELDDLGATDCVPEREAWRSADRLACPAPPPVSEEDDYGWFDITGPCAWGTEIWRRVWAGVDHNYPTGPALERYRTDMVLFFRRHGMLP